MCRFGPTLPGGGESWVMYKESWDTQRRLGTENVENTLSNESKWPTIYFQTYNMRLKKRYSCLKQKLKSRIIRITVDPTTTSRLHGPVALHYDKSN